MGWNITIGPEECLRLVADISREGYMYKDAVPLCFLFWCPLIPLSLTIANNNPILPMSRD